MSGAQGWPGAESRPRRVIGVDWSGARSGERRKIWLAEVVDGEPGRLECVRGRREIAEQLIAAASEDPSLVVGLDFAFSFPLWFLRERGVSRVQELWRLAASEGETWLAGCEPPFWGRPGRPRPALPSHYRRTELESPPDAGSQPKSVFQIGGAGSVGTGSIRGMPVLAALAEAGFRVWPFEAPAFPLVVEIYPRLLTGPVVKTSAPARRTYLAERYPTLPAEWIEKASASEDAFDAAISALVMSQHIRMFEVLRAATDEDGRLEGAIWHPGMTP